MKEPSWPVALSSSTPFLTLPGYRPSFPTPLWWSETGTALVAGSTPVTSRLEDQDLSVGGLFFPRIVASASIR